MHAVVSRIVDKYISIIEWHLNSQPFLYVQIPVDSSCGNIGLNNTKYIQCMFRSLIELWGLCFSWHSNKVSEVAMVCLNVASKL